MLFAHCFVARVVEHVKFRWHMFLRGTLGALPIRECLGLLLGDKTLKALFSGSWIGIVLTLDRIDNGEII